MITESQGVIGAFSRRQDAEYTIKALVIIDGFKQEQFFIITDDTDTNEHTVIMYGSQESVSRARVFLQGPVPAQEDADEERSREAKQSVTRVRMFWGLAR